MKFILWFIWGILMVTLTTIEKVWELFHHEA